MCYYEGVASGKPPLYQDLIVVSTGANDVDGLAYVHRSNQELAGRLTHMCNHSQPTLNNQYRVLAWLISEEMKRLDQYAVTFFGPDSQPLFSREVAYRGPHLSVDYIERLLTNVNQILAEFDAKFDTLRRYTKERESVLQHLAPIESDSHEKVLSK